MAAEGVCHTRLQMKSMPKFSDPLILMMYYTVDSLVKGFLSVLREVKAKTNGDTSISKPTVTIAAEKADVSLALSTIEDISLLAPRGKFSVYCFQDRFIFRNKTTDLELPYKAVSRVLASVPHLKRLNPN